MSSKIQTLHLDGTTLEYSVRKSNRARRLQVSVYRDGRVEVVVPRRVALYNVEPFVREKSGWILERVQKAGRRVMHPLFSLDSDDHYFEHKEVARELLETKAAFWNIQLNFDYGRISVKRQKSMWGSCSSKKNLNFNYKIMFLPEEVQDYIVVHELCHLQEMNHSKRFWDLVASVLPEYKKAQKVLKGFCL